MNEVVKEKPIFILVAGSWSRSDLGRAWRDGLLNAPRTCILPGTDIVLHCYTSADAAFPLTTNMMRPYAKPRNRRLTDKERIFNYRLSRGRRVVENAFGICASRWRIFRRPIIATQETTDEVVKAGTVLHNYLRKRMPSRYNPSSMADRETEDGQLIPGEWRTEGEISNLRNVVNVGTCRNSTNEAYAMRNTLRDFFVSPAGVIEKQYGILSQGYRFLEPRRVFLDMEFSNS